ncbi:MAG TPA: hypothetical protein VJS17_08830 [Pyrinomonadaceae bacterium]|nr:hypothetical protein [Pyrinomonadaceae bacterium]
MIVDSLDKEFSSFIEDLKRLATAVNTDLLYRHPPAVSIGEQILRSAAAIEQTFGGLTSNLWDDPFEWTLPETLSTPAAIVEYLSEVDALRQLVFNSINGDTDLVRYISVPSGEATTLVKLLTETLVRASDHRGRAIATLKILSGEGAARFII